MWMEVTYAPTLVHQSQAFEGMKPLAEDNQLRHLFAKDKKSSWQQGECYNAADKDDDK